jgi:hypothetical protein
MFIANPYFVCEAATYSEGFGRSTTFSHRFARMSLAIRRTVVFVRLWQMLSKRNLRAILIQDWHRTRTIDSARSIQGGNAHDWIVVRGWHAADFSNRFGTRARSTSGRR